MAQGRWQTTDEALAIEAFLVLIKRESPTKTYSRKELTGRLIRSEVYVDFLKLCLECDASMDLLYFKKGLKLVIKSIGPSQFAGLTGVSRMTIHRMLAKAGNPRLGSLMAILNGLGLRFWIVDQEFIEKRTELKRPKREVSMFGPRRNPRFHPNSRVAKEVRRLTKAQRSELKKS